MTTTERPDSLKTYLIYFDEYGTNGELSSNFLWKNTRTVGHNLPRWRRVIALHQNATTELSGTKLSYKRVFGTITTRIVDSSSGGYDDTYISRGIHLPGPGPSIGLSVAPDQSAADNVALTNFVKKARAAQRTLQGGVVLAEIRDTIRLVKRPLKSLRDYTSKRISELEKVRTRRRIKVSDLTRRRRDALRAVSGQWLETSFGMIPFVSDINDAASLLWEVATQSKHATKPVRGVGSQSIEEDGGVQSSGAGFLYDGMAQFRLKGTVSVRYYGQVKVEIPQISNPSSLLQGAGLTLTDFVPTLYEAMPWSFLIDYFSNVGEILEAFTFARSNLAWVSRGTLNEVSSFYTDLRPVNTNYSSGNYSRISSGTPGYVMWTKRTINRAVYDGDLIPSLEFSLPGKNSLKWLNIAALIGSRKSLTPFIN